jgi:DNA-directed RNA polymerase specialized sigma24 family protein
LRKEKRRKQLETMKYSRNDSVYCVQEEHYLEHDVMVILEQLPPIKEKVLSYRLFLDMPYYEIASILGITESSAKVIFQRANRAQTHSRKGVWI